MNATTKPEPNALTLPERAAVALGTAEHEIKLRELLTNSARIVAPANKAGRDECHTAYMVLKNTRCAITNLAAEATEDAKAFTKAVKTESERLIAITAAEETRLQALRDEWDAKVEAEKQAKLAAERARMTAHEQIILDIQAIPLGYVGSTAFQLAEALQKHAADPTLTRDFEEYAGQAQAAQLQTFERLTDMHNKAVEAERAAAEAKAAAEAEAERIAAEKAELARQRAENERIANEQAAERQRLADAAAAQQAEVDRVRKQAEANLAAEHAALDEKIRRDREQLAAEQEAANRELAAARDKLNKAQAEHDARIATEQKAVQDEIDRAAQAEADESERVRLQGLADQHQVDAHASPVLAALCDAAADIDEALRDDEIIELVAATFGMTTLEAIDRIQAIDFAAARTFLEVAA